MSKGEIGRAETAAGYPTASVVIPTFNRLDALVRVIAAVEAQERSNGSELEVVVVDDGSTDGTGEWLDARCDEGLVVLRQANAGPARARNRGVEAAHGEVVLFLGDDTVPEPGWLLCHLERHRLLAGDRPLAVLGYTSFPLELETPFSRWINELGAQFGYLLIERAGDVPFNFFYTSNISVERAELIRLGGFREDFPAAAWEDIELAYRAVGDGLRIVYEPRARVVHDHRVRPRTFCRRQRTAGRSAAIFSRLHPELGHFLGVERPRPGRLASRALRALLAPLVALGDRVPGLASPGLFQRYLDLAYLEGLAEGLQEDRRR